MGAFSQLWVLLSLLFLFSVVGVIRTPVNAELSWCTAKPSTSEEELQANVDYACSHGVDCTPIKEGGSCFYPNTKAQHASFVMNSYYHNQGTQTHACYFKNSGLIDITDPSYGNCKYQRGDGGQLEKSRRWCVAKPGTDEAILQINIDYVCTRVDCKDIQEGNACFTPNNLLSHASYAMNLFYHTKGKGIDCDFKTTGSVVLTDPSYGMCTYVSSNT